MSMKSMVTLLCAITLILHTHNTYSVDLKDSCATCRQITDNFVKGLRRTAKKNFGGGNTAWEERKLSKYETSEIRLMEILESLCDFTSFECNHMVEEHEEHFETWWFKRRAKHPDIFKWFCIDTIEVCCPNGTFGPDCSACVGGSGRPCHGNGACDGDGTRAGHGRCSCNQGYQGEFCLDCTDGYFNEQRNDTFSLCTECHASCKTCTGSTNQDCGECKHGWRKDEEGACSDIDECLNESRPCKEDQYCLNTKGSYSCTACDKACSVCIGAGPDHCLTCAEGYKHEEGTCTDIDECELAEQVCTGEHPECVNTEGSYRCLCARGFQEQGGVCVQTREPENHSNVEESQEEENSKEAVMSTGRHPEERDDL